MEKGLPPPGGDQKGAAILITTYAVLTTLSVAIVAVRFIARAVEAILMVRMIGQCWLRW